MSDLMQPDAPEQPDVSPEGAPDQDVAPGDESPEESAEDLAEQRESEFQKKFGHLKGEALKTARKVFDAHKAHEDEINARPGYVGR